MRDLSQKNYSPHVYHDFIELDVSLEAASLFLQGRGKAVYILPSLDPTLALLLMGCTQYDDDDVYHDIIFKLMG
ncbi:hypothetical protein Hanom_Chr13g01217621 [Helianthus anomalus]